MILFDILKSYIPKNYLPTDILTIGESPLAIMQGKYIDYRSVNVDPISRLLCKGFHPTSSLATACGMQTLINISSPTRVIASWLIGGIFKFFGIKGIFYRLAGEQARLIDDITGTTPPYDKSIVLGPIDTQTFCIKAAKKWAVLNKIKTVEIQGPGNLGTKMKRQFSKTHSEKNLSHQIQNPILIIGSDLPSISHFELIQAIQILNHKEMVLGPSNDGGYLLIGLSNKLLNPLCAWPFSGISWGTDKVLQETIRLASLNQIDYQLLQTKNDLDNISDLSPWLDYKSFQLSASLYQL